MTKHFSEQDSEGPDLVNFQLSFWRLAVEKFETVKADWQEFAVEEGDENEEYTDNDFVIDAAVALVLAGTSVTELIGQNIPAKGDRTENLRPGYKQLIADPIPGDVEAFFQIYDDLRHFGPAKYDAIRRITEEKFCEYMSTAQAIWIDVLKKTRGRVSDDFARTFRLED